MNLRQFASITGYSLSTVSKAFSDSKEISKETKKIILDKAKELGCLYKYLKVKRTKKIIAVICPEIKSEYYAKILSVISELLDKKGFISTFSVTNFNLNTEEELLKFYSTQTRADGIIIVGGKSKAKKYSSTPTVYIISQRENPYADCFNTDFYTGICEAVYKFKTFGHTKIAFIGEHNTTGKRNLFIRAMEYYGLTVNPEFIIESDLRFEDAGSFGMEKLLALKEKPTAVLCAYDYIALGVINTLSRHGLKMPQDISVIGFDDIDFSANEKISLSTITSNTYNLCSMAVDLIEKKTTSNYFIINNYIEKSTLCDRQSVHKLN